jgi:hypothetical protein
VQASIGANTYVITGNSENKNLQDLLPGNKKKITLLSASPRTRISRTPDRFLNCFSPRKNAKMKMKIIFAKGTSSPAVWRSSI